MGRQTWHWIGLLAGLSLWCSVARAGLDGPDSYVHVEVSVRQATIEGMRQRLALLNSSQYTRDSDIAVDNETQARIAGIYTQFNTNAGAHGAYGTRHRARIDSWLDDNPTWKSQLAALDSQFRSLSAQLSASRHTP